MRTVIIGLLFSFNAAAIDWGTLVMPKVLELGIGNPSLNFDIKQENEKIAEYAVNSGARFGIGIGNDYYGFRVSSYSSPDPLSIEKKGKTLYTDYQFRFNLFQKHSVELIYQEYSGYYLEEATTASSLMVIRPDIVTGVTKVQYTYVYAPKRFSLDHLLNRVDYDKADGGSWLLSAGAGTYRLNADSPLTDSTSIDEIGQLTKLNAGNIEFGGGYGYHLAMQPFFAGGLIRIAAGAQQRFLGFISGATRQESGQTINSGLIATLGIDKPTWFTSITIQAKTTQFYFANESNLAFVTGSVAITLGLRL